MERFSTPMMVSGIVLTGLGVVGLFAGAFMLSESESNLECGYYGGTYVDSCADNEDQAATGTGLMIAGAVAAVVGIPLIVVGARKVPIKREPQPTALRPDIRISHRTASLRWTF
jgi:hypothetical protein